MAMVNTTVDGVVGRVACDKDCRMNAFGYCMDARPCYPPNTKGEARK